MRMRHIFLGLAILLPVAISQPGSAADPAGTPRTLVVDLARKALVLAGSRAISSADRQFELGKLLDAGFDMPRIAAYVVGPYWQEASADERQAFAVALRDYVGRTYTDGFADYSAGMFRVVGLQEANAAGTVVSTEIARTAVAEKADQTYSDQPVRLDWLVVAKDRYRIVDVTINGVSMAATMRAEFTSYLRKNRGSLKTLIQGLQAMATARR